MTTCPIKPARYRWYALIALAAQALNVASAAEQHSPPPQSRFITLITGDRVVLSTSGRELVQVDRGPGRERMGFSITHEQVTASGSQHLYVIPNDAQPLLSAGKLDRQLFDVTGLLNAGYDDENSTELPLIVSYAGTTSARTSMRAQSFTGATVAAYFVSAQASAVRARKRELGTFWNTLSAPVSGARGTAGLLAGGSEEIEKVWLDRVLQPLLDRSSVQIGARHAWNTGYTGRGVAVAVLDTGVDQTHPDLIGKVVASQEFVGTDEVDHVGHGTHVAATIAGSGAAGGRYRGIAPDATIISGKVCDVFPHGCPWSAILAGMEWAVRDMNAKIVNMSLGGRDSVEIDPVEAAVNRLTRDYDALFVIAAGNDGVPESVGSPATAEAALAVAAVDRTDTIAPFSSRGPRLGDRGVKPEISAPGVQIVAARASGVDDGLPAGELYRTLSGTSMATPHVAGVAALLKQRFPGFNASELKSGLLATATRNSATTVFDQGAGRVDAAAAIDARIIASPATVNLGVALWPHEDDEPIRKTVVYRNVNDTAAVLTFSVIATGPDGTSAPAGMFHVSPASLSVSAGSTATVTLTVDTRTPAKDGIYSGWLLGTGAGKPVAVPFSIEREDESYDLEFEYLGLDGAAAVYGGTTLFALDTSQPFLAQTSSQAPRGARVRVPRGRYELRTDILPELPPQQESASEANTSSGQADTLMLQPMIDIRRTGKLTFDARQAREIIVQSPRRDAQLALRHIGWETKVTWGRLQVDWLTTGRIYTAQLGPAPEGFISFVSDQWRSPTSGATVAQIPELYAQTWLKHRAFPTGLNERMRLDRMARVDAHYLAAASSVTSGDISTFSDVNGRVAPYAFTTRVSFPYRRTEYYGTAPGTPWTSRMSVAIENEVVRYDLSTLISAPTQYRLGERKTVHWNVAPLGPYFTRDPMAEWAVRRGDTFQLFAPMFGDSAGHSGVAQFSRARMALYENGKLLKEVPDIAARFPVSSQPATYRLEVEVAQDVLSIASESKATWTFDSERSEVDVTNLPLMTVRFEVPLDANQQAKAGTRIEVPVSVWRNGSSREIDVARLGVDASFDDGATWRPIRVNRGGDGWVASLEHPRNARFVSLRASAASRLGNSVEQTVLRAYSLAEKRGGR